MSVDTLPIFQAIKTKMSFLGDRARVLAENIANADTPDYKAKDLKPLDFDEVLRQQTSAGTGSGMRATHERHLKGGGARMSAFEIEKANDGHEGLNGNTVSLQDQMVKAGDTQMQYEMATSLYRKSLNMIRIAIGKGGGS
ncbi:MAG: flagellar basal body rod protein FlgB [Parvularculaceae bacterium]